MLLFYLMSVFSSSFYSVYLATLLGREVGSKKRTLLWADRPDRTRERSESSWNLLLHPCCVVADFPTLNSWISWCTKTRQTKYIHRDQTCIYLDNFLSMPNVVYFGNLDTNIFCMHFAIYIFCIFFIRHTKQGTIMIYLVCVLIDMLYMFCSLVHSLHNHLTYRNQHVFSSPWMFKYRISLFFLSSDINSSPPHFINCLVRRKKTCMQEIWESGRGKKKRGFF